MKNSDFITNYLTAAQSVLANVAEQQQEQLDKAATMIADAYAAGKTIYIFGCTHSAILAEDVFYRAGAPTFWRPLWGPGMSITTTPGFLTSAAEHNEQLGEAIINCSQIGADDVLVVLSTSGKNGAPVAVAETALKKGVKVIAVCSGNYRNQKGNHSRIANLFALEDQILIIDNHVPCGDASVVVCNDTPMAPVSTIVGSFIMHTISALSIEKLRAMNVDAPVFLSSNAPGGKERNEALLSRKEIQDAYLLP